MPRFPRWRNADEIDRQAKRLYEMLMESDDAGPVRRPQPPEPEHPLSVQAEAWRRAIYAHDPVAARVAADAVAFMLSAGYGERPVIAAIVAHLSMSNRLSSTNLVPLTTLQKVVEG